MNVNNSNLNELVLINYIGSHSKEDVAKYKENLGEEEKRVVQQIQDLFDTEAIKLTNFNKQMLVNSLRFKLVQSKSLDPVDFSISKDVNDFIEGAIQKVKQTSEETTIQKMAAEIDKPILSKHDLAQQFSNVKESVPIKDNVVFLTTNEVFGQGHIKVLNTLAQEPIQGNTFVENHGSAIIAVSSFWGLNMAATRGENDKSGKSNIDTIIMLDVTEQMRAFWALVKNLIASSETKEEFLSKIKQFDSVHLTPEFKATGDFKGAATRGYIENFLMDGFEYEVEDGISWLSTDERFAKIKEIFDSGRFVFKLINIMDEPSVQSLHEAVKSTNLKVDTVYISNVLEMEDSYKSPEGFETFKKGLNHLLDNSSLLVDAVSLVQRVQKGVKNDLPSWNLADWEAPK